MTAPTEASARRTAARWRKAKGIQWGKWELWRGESWLAYIHECRLIGGGRVYLWVAVGLDLSGQAAELIEAKKAAKYAIEHAELAASISELIAECEAGT